MQLFEQYRPRTWGDVVGQEKALKKIETLRKRGFGGRAVWLSGQSGTGKTTIGRLIAAELADDIGIEEIDAQHCTPARLRDIERECRCRVLGAKTGRVYIVNEAHGLTAASIRQLLVMLERIPEHVCWIFTTTTQGQEALFAECDDSSPLLSRCAVIELSRRDLAKPFAERARMIAQTEGLDGRDIGQYIRLVQKHRNNLRGVLSAIEAGEMSTDESEA